ncbi:MAG: hypothetical protein GX447_00615 [Elusimicrobia bacterium]|nr:hypothetical protein [Elusimicrobiota bacterium]
MNRISGFILGFMPLIKGILGFEREGLMPECPRCGSLMGYREFYGNAFWLCTECRKKTDI